MIVELEIRTWVNLHAGAAHYYGVLRYPGRKPVRLTRVLTAEEAERFNDHDNTPGLYNAGSTTERFVSRDQVHARAQEVWEELYPEATKMKEIS